jgi:hypothetical protein
MGVKRFYAVFLDRLSITTLQNDRQKSHIKPQQQQDLKVSHL